MILNNVYEYKYEKIIYFYLHDCPPTFTGTSRFSSSSAPEGNAYCKDHHDFVTMPLVKSNVCFFLYKKDLTVPN